MFDISIFFTLIFILVKEEMIMDMSVWFLMGAALVFFMQCGFGVIGQNVLMKTAFKP